MTEPTTIPVMVAVRIFAQVEDEEPLELAEAWGTTFEECRESMALALESVASQLREGA